MPRFGNALKAQVLTTKTNLTPNFWLDPRYLWYDMEGRGQGQGLQFGRRYNGVRAVNSV